MEKETSMPEFSWKKKNKKKTSSWKWHLQVITLDLAYRISPKYLLNQFKHLINRVES